MKRILAFWLSSMIAGYSHNLWSAQADCIDEMKYQKTREIYADLFAKYDLPTVSQELLGAISATNDLKEQVNTCRKNLNETDQERCEPLVEQYNAKRVERDALSNRLSMALKMQEYLLTVKLMLEQPICGK
ncbi:MAG TPA: hypothetical protein VMJ33_06905 [Gallionella sp.]|nr:hypothetical protein [Gallionella sp.]